MAEEDNTEKFRSLQEDSIDDQAEFFGRRFIFTLGDDYNLVFELANEFKEALAGDSSAKGDKLSQAGSSNLLQRTGATRTIFQKNQELKDVDVDGDGMLSFSEFLLLHFKVVILREYFARHEMEPDVELDDSNPRGVGIVGVGERLVNELFSIPQGVDKNLERQIKEFQEDSAKRKAKIEKLQAKVDAGGVKGMAAKNELEQLKQEDSTEKNAIEAEIALGVKRAIAKSRKELATKQDKEAQDGAASKASGKGNLANRAAAFRKSISKRMSLGKKN